MPSHWFQGMGNWNIRGFQFPKDHQDPPNRTTAHQ